MTKPTHYGAQIGTSGFHVGQRVKSTYFRAKGQYADIVGTSDGGHGARIRLYVRLPDGTYAPDMDQSHGSGADVVLATATAPAYVTFSYSFNYLEAVRGRPYLPGIDPPRMFGKDAPKGADAAATPKPTAFRVDGTRYRVGERLRFTDGGYNHTSGSQNADEPNPYYEITGHNKDSRSYGAGKDGLFVGTVYRDPTNSGTWAVDMKDWHVPTGDLVKLPKRPFLKCVDDPATQNPAQAAPPHDTTSNTSHDDAATLAAVTDLAERLDTIEEENTARDETTLARLATLAEQDVQLAKTLEAAVTTLTTLKDSDTELARKLDTLEANTNAMLAAIAAPEVTAMPAAQQKRVAQIAAAIGTGATSPILDKLRTFYHLGRDMGTYALLAAPPSMGKSWACRQLGGLYDRYLEHSCSDDMDENATLLGGPIPTGTGFVVVDGVLTEAVRAASEGQTVLFLLDEILRLPSKSQEFLLSFLTGFRAPDGERHFRLRTRRHDPATGALEVIECPAANLHIVAATNLSLARPIEAFWSRFETVRFDFDRKAATDTALAILVSQGITKGAKAELAKVWAYIMDESRKAVGELRLAYPVDLRMLERAAILSGADDTRSVAQYAAKRLADNVANWDATTGDTDADSVALVVPWVTKLTSL